MVYCFPILENTEILTCLQELQIPFSETMLLSPRYEGVRYMYEEFVCLFYDLARDEIRQRLVNAFQTMPCSNFYFEAIPIILFIQLLVEIMSASGVCDFNLKDVFKPTYDRTRRNISAIINLGKYREEKVLLFTSHSEKINSIMQKIVAIETKNHNLHKQLEVINSWKNMEDRNIKKLNEKIEKSLIFFHYYRYKIQKLLGDEIKTIIHHYDLFKRDKICVKDIKELKLTLRHLKQKMVPNFSYKREELRYAQRKCELRKCIYMASTKKNHIIQTWSTFIENWHKNIHRLRFNLNFVLKITILHAVFNLNITNVKARVEKNEISLIAMNIREAFLLLKKNILKKEEIKVEQEIENRVNCISNEITEIAKLVIIKKTLITRNQNTITKKKLEIKNHSLAKKILRAVISQSSFYRPLLNQYYTMRVEVTRFDTILIRKFHQQNSW